MVMNLRKQIRSKVINLFKESLSYNDADTKQPSDPYGAGPCPICGGFAKGTFRHKGAPVFCEKNHKWRGSCGHGGECDNTPVQEEKLQGGAADNKTISEIAAIHSGGNTAGRLYTTMFYLIKSQIDDGIKDEMEHTNDPNLAFEIVKDHLISNPRYYLDLKKAGIEETQLNEMPAWNDRNKSIASNIDKDFDKTFKWLKQGNFKQIEELKIIKGYITLVFSRNNDTFYVLVYENWLGREVAGEFVWGKNGKNQWQTESAGVAEEHQGKGIAITVYDYMIEKYFKTLYSDSSLTGEEGYGSFNIWNKLSRLINYAYLYDERSKTHTPVKEFTRDMMGDANVLFVVSTEEIKTEEKPLNEMPYIHDLNGKSLDLQMEKWTTEEEFKNFLMNLFVGETISDPKQPKLQITNPEELIKKLTDFNNDINNPATQLLIQFTRKFRNPKATLKTISKEDVEYLKSFIIDVYNHSKEKFI
jgi:hypothetical protein